MIRLSMYALCLLACCLVSPAMLMAADPEPVYKVDEQSVAGRIVGENISFTVALTLTVEKPGSIPFVLGDLVYEHHESLPDQVQLLLREADRGYDLHVARKGVYTISVTFAARPAVLAGGEWRESSFSIPSSRKRDLKLLADRHDLEVDFPGALQQVRSLAEGQLSIQAILGPGHPFAVRWKPQVEELEADLVFATESNTIATISPGTIRIDDIVVFDVSQGTMRECSFAIPPGLAVTQVRGSHIRTWRMEPADKPERLHVVLNREIDKRYALHIEAEQALPALPAGTRLPSIQPLGALRSHGYLALGTDSSIHLLIAKASGCSQIDKAAFRSMRLAEGTKRSLPTSKAFAFNFPSSPYQIDLQLADIVPAYDVQQHLALQVREDDLILDASFELDVRDAPIREVQIAIPAGLTVAQIAGAHIDVDGSGVGAVADGRKKLTIPLTQPLQGRGAISLRLERGRSILDEDFELLDLQVLGAKNQRGSILIASDEGVEIDSASLRASDGLDRVHVGSLGRTVPGAQIAFRFSQPDWRIGLRAGKRASTIRAESFHLLSVGDGICYGNTVVNYAITGAPIDELRFRIDQQLSGIEFVGTDVVRATQEGEFWTVKLRRKVIGDYNIGIAFNRSLTRDPSLPLGAVSCRGFSNETGYIVLASRRNVDLAADVPQDRLVSISPEELPSNYRLLVSAPILRAWKYMNRAEQSQAIELRDFSQGKTLDGIIELMDLQTQLSIRRDARVESHTLARYKIKNAHRQFIDLNLPSGARPWGGVTLIDQNGQRHRATVSEVDGVLKVQLDRPRNPNEPITVELEYGQSHGVLAGDHRIALTAPLADVGSSYVSWQVQSHDDWSLLPVPGSMVIENHQRRITGMSAVLNRVTWAWRYGVQAWAAPGFQIVLGVLLAVGLFVVGIWRRRWLPRLLLVLLLGYALITGITAASLPGVFANVGQTEALTVLQASQAMDFIDDAAPQLAVEIRQAWLQDSSPALITTAVLLALGLAVLGLVARKLRVPCLAGAGVAVLVLCGSLPPLRGLIVHALTWLPPVLVAVVVLGRFGWSKLRGRAARQSGLAVAALCLLALTGCTGGGTGTRPIVPTDSLTLDKVAVQLVEQEDSMKVLLDLQLHTDKAISFPLLTKGAVLMSDEEPLDDVVVELKDGLHYLSIGKKGSYAVQLEFLTPMPGEREDGLKTFSVPMPRALTNRVSVDVLGAMEVVCPTAVQLQQAPEQEQRSRVTAILGPGEDAYFLWRPRARETAKEKPVFFAEAQSAHRFDSGLIEGRHRIRLRIAQGELQELAFKVPAHMTVTAVEGAHVSTWRYHPTEGRLEAVLAKPVSSAYELQFVTQINAEDLPGSYTVAGIETIGAEHQRGILAIAPTNAVHVELGKHPQQMSADDFARQGQDLLTSVGVKQARYAFRLPQGSGSLEASMRAVQAELRSTEQASFSISDDRLVYNGKMTIDITKAGVFQAVLQIPDHYLIESLQSPGISHWDERHDASNKLRIVTVHFPNRTQGSVPIDLHLYKTVSVLPARLDVPRVGVVGSLKHRGRVVIAAEQGVRLLVDQRQGVSELHPKDLGIRDEQSLAFSFIDPAWAVQLKTEVIKPLMHVDSLHVARVTDGLVRHSHHFRWRLQHAGSKLLRLVLPAGMPPVRELGLTINGPDIADWRSEQVGDRQVLAIELTRKWFDRTYPLALHYETRYDRQQGDFQLMPLLADQADLQRHHVAVFATDRVELQERERSGNLIDAEARNIDAAFGAGDLSGAAFCWRSNDNDYGIVLRALRHDAANLLAADVQSARLSSVMTRNGARMTTVHLDLLVGNKRYLEVTLPTGASLWSALVNGRAVEPARHADRDNTHLLPLAQGSVEDVRMEVEFLYVEGPGRYNEGGVQAYQLVGPRFDLPMRNVEWTVYAPEGYAYDEFGGTLVIDRDLLRRGARAQYDLQVYDRNVAEEIAVSNGRALQLSSQGAEYCEQGDQYQARMALEWAYNYSFNDKALNEDARVQLHTLNRQQALVGLVGRRGSLRQGKEAQRYKHLDLGDNYSSAEAKQLESNLAKDDIGNLRKITDRLVEVQHLAIAPAAQINVNMPLRGRVLTFRRELQVDLESPLAISFNAKRLPQPSALSWSSNGLLLVVLMVLLGVPLFIGRRWARIDAWFTPAPRTPELAEEYGDKDLLAGIPGIPSADSIGESLDPSAPEVDPDREADWSGMDDDDDSQQDQVETGSPIDESTSAEETGEGAQSVDDTSIDPDHDTDPGATDADDEGDEADSDPTR